MAFGFNQAAVAQPVGVDQSLMTPMQAPQQDAPQAAPQPQQSQQYAPVQDIPVSPGEVALAMLFHGGTPADAAQHVRAVKIANIQSRMAMSQAQSAFEAIQQLPQDQRLAIYLNSGEAGKALADRMATHALSGGQTLVNGGPGGAPVFAPVVGLDADSGKGYAISPQGMATFGQLAGKKTLDPTTGAVTDSRLGLTGQSVAVPTKVASDETFGDYVTHMTGAPSAAAAGQGASAAQSGEAVDPHLPRGLRNNNPQKVRALPHGQMWNGQTGTDANGYAVFGSPEDGLRAARTNLHSYAVRDGVKTLAQAIQRWAPDGASNNTAGYINYVAQKTGLDPNAPVNLADPKIQQPLMHAMAEFENGPQALAGWQHQPAAQQVSQPQGAQTGQQGGFTPLRQGKTTVVLPPTDPAYRGVDAGVRLQRDPKGNVTTYAKPNTDDQKKVAEYQDTAKTLEDLSQIGHRFQQLNHRTGTGIGYEPLDVPVPLAHGAHINLNLPGAVAERLHRDIPAMENLTNQMALAQRTPGMRVTQLEFQKFLSSAPNIENFGKQNDEIISGYEQLATQRRAYANFMSNYLAQHGSLTGADQAWKQQQSGTHAQAAPKLRTYNPKTGAIE